ncbi:MAG TPA: (Fe-S)-binding protein [Polyangia bacterium]|nr:(Fe-S)-binding protein [Polyangia bacterium]
MKADPDRNYLGPLAPSGSGFAGAGAPALADVAACVHCGMCLEACPTYKELREEADSPRGRLYLIRGLVEQKLAPTPAVVAHLDRCLDCRACETACPSTVKYGEILEKTRTVLEPTRPPSRARALARWLGFRVLLPSRAAQTVFFKVVWVAQALGLVRLGSWLARRGWLPRPLAALAASPPEIPASSFRARAGQTSFPAKGERRARVALFTGCVADHLFADVNDATVRVLVENGCDVELVADEVCCGALHIHNGARDQAQELARANIRAFAALGADRFDAVISNAAGCGAELRHYGALLPDEPEAAHFGARVRDVAEFLAELGLREPPARETPPVRVAYDEPCHLVHAQKISEPPKRLLRACPGVALVHLDEADACCGGAGVYWLTEPELSARVTARKIDAVRRSGAEVVATGNPGCLLQIRNAARAAGLSIRVAHPIELLADAYARPTR